MCPHRGTVPRKNNLGRVKPFPPMRGQLWRWAKMRLSHTGLDVALNSVARPFRAVGQLVECVEGGVRTAGRFKSSFERPSRSPIRSPANPRSFQSVARA